MRHKILIAAEEHGDIAHQLELHLGNAYELIEAHDSRHALQLAKNIHPNFVFVSHPLSDSPGITLLGDLKKNSPHLPVIFTAKNPTSELIISAFRSGADDFIMIPIMKEELCAALARKNYNRSADQWQSKKDTTLQVFLGIVAAKWRSQIKAKLFKIAAAKNKVASSNSPEKKILPILAAPSPSAPKDRSSPSLPTVDIQFFGNLVVNIDGRLTTDWCGKKSKQLFAYLAYFNKPIHKEMLMAQFWPDYGSDSARNCLNVTMHHLRKIFGQCDIGDKLIVFHDEFYSINSEYGVRNDVKEFQQHWRAGMLFEKEQNIAAAIQEYVKATDYYRGDFLEDFMYAEWTDLEREYLREIYLLILNKLSHYYSLNGKPKDAIEMCAKILKKDNCREDIHRRLMRCYSRIGQRDRAIRQYEKCKSILEHELGVSPCRSTQDLYEKIKNHPESNDLSKN